MEEAAEGGFTVTSPVSALREAFGNARDAMNELARARVALRSPMRRTPPMRAR
jgi:hypothetical protein